MATVGVWAPQGAVLSTINSSAPQQANVLYKSGALILSPNPDGKIFKMWVGTSAGGGFNYAESNDGISWTAYSSNPVIASAGISYGRIFMNGSTYYLYISFNPTGGGAIAAYTSPDGVTWTLKNANAITVGGAGAWDHVSVWASGVMDVVNGTWYLTYAGSAAIPQASYPCGLATSTDGINWTKYSGNPIINDGSISANFNFRKVNGIYYGWTQYVPAGVPAVSNGLPSDIGRYTATSPQGPWTNPAVPTAYRTLTSEGPGYEGELGDPSLVEANGNVYMYTTAKVNGLSAGGGTINLFIASSTTIAQLITGYEGIINVPFPGTGGFELNLVQQAADNFQRADANPISGNWTQLFVGSGWGPLQIVSHAVEAASTSTNAADWYNGISWTPYADQWSTVQVGVTNAGVFNEASVRNNESGVNTKYRAYFDNSGGGNGLSFAKIVSGTNTVLLHITTGFTTSVGDNFTICVIGSKISVFQNRNLWGVITDTAIASGAPGMEIYTTTLANSKISAWSGGSFQSTPPIPSSGGSGSLAMMGCGQ